MGRAFVCLRCMALVFDHDARSPHPPFTHAHTHAHSHVFPAASQAIEAAGGDRITRAKKKAVAFNVKVDAEHKRTSIGAALAPLAPPVATDVPASPPAAAAATIAPPAAPTAATDVPASPPAPAAASIARAPEAAPVADGTAVCAARTAEADPLRAVAAESATAGELDRALFARHKPFRPFK